MSGRTVVVLGGGVGGLTAANELRARLGREHRVVLVERRREHLFAPSLLWLMVGLRRREQATRDLRAMLRPGVELVTAEVGAIDGARGTVATPEREIPYDHLVVALGAENAPEALPGYAAGHDVFDLDGAERFRQALDDFRGGRVLVAVAALPYRCPAAPYEAALLVEDALRRRGLRGRSEVAVHTPEPQPMPVADPVLGAAVTALLAGRDIGFHPSRQLGSIDAGARELVFADGARERFDLLALVPPHRSPRVIRESALANAAGWVPVDGRSLRTSFERVHAIGDVTAIPLPSGKLLPKAGVFAHAEALVVARAIAADVTGEPAPSFDGKGYCWVEVGGGRAAFASGDFYADPAPAVRLQAPGRQWYAGKVLFERYWMGAGLERALAMAALRLGAKAAGVPASL